MGPLARSLVSCSARCSPSSPSSPSLLVPLLLGLALVLLPSTASALSWPFLTSGATLEKAVLPAVSDDDAFPAASEGAALVPASSEQSAQDEPGQGEGQGGQGVQSFSPSEMFDEEDFPQDQDPGWGQALLATAKDEQVAAHQRVRLSMARESHPLVFDNNEDFPVEGAEGDAIPEEASRKRLRGAPWRRLLSASGTSHSVWDYSDDFPLDGETDYNADVGPLKKERGSHTLLELAEAAAEAAGLEDEFPLVFQYSEDFPTGGEGDEGIQGQQEQGDSPGASPKEQGESAASVDKYAEDGEGVRFSFDETFDVLRGAWRLLSGAPPKGSEELRLHMDGSQGGASSQEEPLDDPRQTLSVTPPRGPKDLPSSAEDDNASPFSFDKPLDVLRGQRRAQSETAVKDFLPAAETSEGVTEDAEDFPQFAGEGDRMLQKGGKSLLISSVLGRPLMRRLLSTQHHAHTRTDAHPRPHSHPRPQPHSHTHTHTGPLAHGHPNLKPNAHAHGKSGARAQTHVLRKPDVHANPHARAQAHPRHRQLLQGEDAPAFQSGDGFPMGALALQGLEGFPLGDTAAVRDKAATEVGAGKGVAQPSRAQQDTDTDADAAMDSAGAMGQAFEYTEDFPLGVPEGYTSALQAAKKERQLALPSESVRGLPEDAQAQAAMGEMEDFLMQTQAEVGSQGTPSVVVATTGSRLHPETFRDWTGHYYSAAAAVQLAERGELATGLGQLAELPRWLAFYWRRFWRYVQGHYVEMAVEV